MLLLSILLIAAGLILVLVEFIVPGGVVGVIGGICMAAAVMIAFTTGGMLSGMLHLLASLLGVAILIPVGMHLFPKTPVGRAMTLSEATPPGDSQPDHLPAPGTRGVALTPLRPSGTARFGAQRVDARSENAMLEPGTALLVVAHENGSVVVRKAPNDG